MIKILGAILIAVILTPIVVIVTIKSVISSAQQWNDVVEKMSKKQKKGKK